MSLDMYILGNNCVKGLLLLMIGIVLVVLEKVWRLYRCNYKMWPHKVSLELETSKLMMLKIFDAEVMITNEGFAQRSGTA